MIDKGMKNLNFNEDYARTANYFEIQIVGINETECCFYFRIVQLG